MKLSSLYVSAENMDRAVDFYTKLFQRQPKIHEARFSSFDLDGFGFDIFAPAEDGEQRNIGNNVVPVFYTNDLRSEKMRIQNLGCEILFEQKVNGYHLFQFHDLEKNVLEIYTEMP